VRTADLNQSDLADILSNRTYRFAILAMSLSNLLDIPQVQDFLRGLLNTMNEYDQAREEPDKPKIVTLLFNYHRSFLLTSVLAAIPVQSNKTTGRWFR
jgi:hypothetical protein